MLLRASLEALEKQANTESETTAVTTAKAGLTLVVEKVA